MKTLNTCILLLLGLLYSSLTIASLNQYNDAEVRLMQQIYQQDNTNISFKEVRRRMFENQFLLSQAEQLMPELIERQSMVGFSTQYHVERYLMSILDSQLNLSTRYVKRGNLTQYNMQWLLKVLPNYPADGQYNAEQIKKMQHTDLSKLFTTAVNLYEFIAPLSMQVRFRLHQGESDLFKTEVIKKQQFDALLLKATPLLLKQGISIAHLEELAKGDILRPSIQSWLGIKEMMHVQSPILDSLEQQISDKEIKTYYQANKARFKYLSEVTAYGVAFTDREQAVHFRNTAKASSFKDALHISHRNDIYAQYHNKLTRKNKSNWAVQLAFTLKAGELSAVMRSPEGLWVVVISYSHQYNYFSATDETVRYQAKKAIAKHQAQQRYQQNWLAWQQQNAVKL
ncbi:peptidyl-prolyl cis-trans isomerase [Pseudoalteromonas arctica]|uniref:Peptidyl-prolyl cis-trans isomerase n=1 Tax=Pseudoalteromonas arctica TaxID=394751 RepID=A0A7Y0DT94_9GAMM|nr:peptidylprolyl isomerase [Pseudoalteromonas arctica]NMM41220.1 peptidyl-prolyl cis-trans isomerase [Pseudoalteromonas arctica]